MPLIDALREEVVKFPLAKQLGGKLPAWEIGSSWRRSREADACKQQILDLVLRNSQVLILDYSESPFEDSLEGDWEELAKGIWVVPSDVRSTPLYHWLLKGNWALYSCLGSLKKPWIFGTHRKPKQVLEELRKENIEFCLYSFHDNDPWFLFLNM